MNITLQLSRREFVSSQASTHSGQNGRHRDAGVLKSDEQSNNERPNDIHSERRADGQCLGRLNALFELAFVGHISSIPEACRSTLY